MTKSRWLYFLNHSPFSSSGAYKCLQHIQKQALSQKLNDHHTLFLYGDAVFLAQDHMQIPQDELHLAEALAKQATQFHLFCCIGAAYKRGILNDELANSLQTEPNLSPHFNLKSLGELHQQIQTSDKLWLFEDGKGIAQSIPQQRVWHLVSHHLPYEGWCFREIFELGLALASFDEKVVVLVSDESYQQLQKPPPLKGLKDLSKLVKVAEHFGLALTISPDLHQSRTQALQQQGLLYIGTPT